MSFDARPRLHHLTVIGALLAAAPLHAENLYTVINLGQPENAGSAIGVRMNDHGAVAGYSIYYSQGEPSMKPWVWTEADGFTILPPPPDMFLGRARAMDINNAGVVVGDGGFDAGIAWRYENGAYETFGPVEGMFIAYLGGVNELGDVCGTAKDASITTEDDAWCHRNDGTDTTNLTPTDALGGRASDLNDARQVCGYTTSFQAVRWDDDGNATELGTTGLAYSFAWGINEAGDVVGSARTVSGNTRIAWIHTDANGQQQIPAPSGYNSAAAVNDLGVVIGNTSPGSGADYGWIWSAEAGTRTVHDVYEFFNAGYSAVTLRDINNEGQLLAHAYDNTVGDWRMLLLTPIDDGNGAACPSDLDDTGTVNFADLVTLLASWGPCDGACGADLDDSGAVDFPDLLALLSAWGPCPE